MATTPAISEGLLAKYEPVIGLEVHVQLRTASKIFCSCSTRFGDPPNTNVCPVCLGLPGALPVLNRKAVEFAALAAMALECRVNETSIFARKNYFYPDLPKGYQISQYDKLLAEFGFIEIDVNGSKTEVKNVNWFRFMRQALEYEIERHIGLIEAGGSITQETRLYNAHERKTYGMRSKEQAHDYRYFPEPDLLPLVVDEKWQAAIRTGLPELPEARRARMMKEDGITAGDAHTLTLTRAVAGQFGAGPRAGTKTKRVAHLGH